MTSLISLLLIGGLAALLAAAAAGIAAATTARTALVTVQAGGSADDATILGSASADADAAGASRLLRRVPPAAMLAALSMLAAALVLRGMAAGRAPWANLHEFSIALAVAILGTYVVLARRHALSEAVGLVPLVALLAAGAVGLALSVDDRIDPLVPALQQPLLLTVHVGAAALAYAVSGVAFVAAAAELAQRGTHDALPGVPSAATLRTVGHRAVLLAFPILTVAIVLGSVWANLAWRSYWSNDPKELAAAATWAVFGAYLHVAGRRDRWARLAPWLIVAGFAGVLFTYIGAGLFLVGEHSYAAP